MDNYLQEWLETFFDRSQNDNQETKKLFFAIKIYGKIKNIMFSMFLLAVAIFSFWYLVSGLHFVDSHSYELDTRSRFKIYALMLPIGILFISAHFLSRALSKEK